MDKVEQIQVALRRLLEQRQRRREDGDAAASPQHDADEEDRLLSNLLSQLDSLKDSSGSLSSQTVDVDQKPEGREDDTRQVVADDIIKELKRVKRQNNITHCLLSLMIFITAIWQFSEVSLLLSLKDKFSHPFRAAGNMIRGVLTGGGNLQETERLNSTSKNHLLETPANPPVGIPELPHVDLPALPLGGGERVKE